MSFVRYVFSALLLLLWTAPAGWAQQPPASAQPAARPAQGGVPESGPLPTGFVIKGRVVDSSNGQAVPFATVSVLRALDSSLVGGSLVEENGRFEVDRVPAGAYLLKINFLGYRTGWREAVIVSAEQPLAQVGAVPLSQATARLNEVLVEGERPVFQLGIDRKTFDVARSTLNPGGSATDVLANVPTVTVDVDGNVSMRNNDNVTIYIDGRPSGITASNRAQVLRQIPASSIERIELITSPSARYDAEGTAGIINIILKKNKLEGFNGSAQVSVGTRDKYNAAANLAYRNKFINAYLNYSFRRNKRFGEGHTDRLTRVFEDSTSSAYTSFRTLTESHSDNWDQNHYVKGGIDFSLPKDNTIGVSGSYNPSQNWSNETLNYAYQNEVGSQPVPSNSQRLSRVDGLGSNYEATLTHVKKYNDKGFEWSSQLNYSDFRQDNTTSVMQMGNILTDSLGNFLNAPYQINPLGTRTRVVTTQTDYVRPLSETTKFELGAKSSTRNLASLQQYYAGPSLEVLPEVLRQRSDFSYHEQIYAAYAIWQQQLGKFGYQAGLRYEQTRINTLFSRSDTAGQSGFQNYGRVIPTINLNYKLNGTHEFQLNYAVRLNRPGAQSLNPFTDYSDPITLRIGNPNLRPETIHAFEANWQLNTGAFTLTSTPFYRYTQSLSTRVFYTDTSGRTVVEQVNAGTRHESGLEFVGRWQVAKGISITGNTSVFYAKLNTTVSNNLTNSNVNYSARILATATVRKGTNVQLTSWYRSPFILPQGVSRPMYSTDIAISQEFWRQKATVSLAVNDVFNTMRFGITTSDRTFTQATTRKRESQIATLTLAYRFGSLDNISRKRDRNSGGGSQGGGDYGY